MTHCWTVCIPSLLDCPVRLKNVFSLCLCRTWRANSWSRESEWTSWMPLSVTTAPQRKGRCLRRTRRQIVRRMAKKEKRRWVKLSSRLTNKADSVDLNRTQKLHNSRQEKLVEMLTRELTKLVGQKQAMLVWRWVLDSPVCEGKEQSGNRKWSGTGEQFSKFGGRD